MKHMLADTYASEDVQILTKNPRDALEKMSHYGALLLGEKTCISYGDKARKSYKATSEKESGELRRLCGHAENSERSSKIGRCNSNEVYGGLV